LRTKHLIKNLRKLGYGKTAIFKAIKNGHDFKLKNGQIYKTAQMGYSFAKHFKQSVNSVVDSLTAVAESMREMVNVFRDLADFIYLNFYDEGERAFLEATGND